MSIFAKISFHPDLAQLIYAIFVIILVPGLVAANTFFLLRSVQRDMDFELNNKALLVQSILTLHLRSSIEDPSTLQATLAEIVKELPEIKAIEVFRVEKDVAQSFSSTSQKTKSVSDPVLNQLAWGTSQVYSKQIKATLGTGPKERLWLVASPLYDGSREKIGVINLYLSAAQIDLITNRTVRDSLLILVGTMVAIVLLLLNHFRFFEASIILKKLREVDQLKDEFISIASHELRTPLTAIGGYAYLLVKNPAVSANTELREEIDIILQATKRLGTLVNDILDVSRIEQNRIKLTLADYDLGEIVEAVIRELFPQAQSKGLQLTYTRTSQPLIIYCDKDRMQQILINLVGNGIKYTLAGEVTIYHRVQDTTVRTFVKDTGVGIRQEDLSKVFGKFTRLYNEKTKDVAGTGLGLWISKQLVERMGGKIAAESIEGHGSQFITSFPLKVAPSPTTPPSTPPTKT